ncbi:hypothetical protein [Sphingomonas pokkalii]|uniref:Uncharacterized protein n=1 Tax=Sphingomonas pokkalii TaxID=2175090 RepID=A0A2U0SHZ2_9SPHN|nr:hypothetical protein [Sphingomonas pokkalii]PVX30956.1 hypothetical protein DD559_17805 [Sphingomonas pokkalii]
MLIVYLYISLAFICCGAAAVHGGWEGRLAGALIMAVILAGRVVGSVDLELATSPWFKLWLDGALLVAFVAIMLVSRRWWPIWIVGLQGNGVLAHLSAILIPEHTPVIYRVLESFWGVPMVLVMAAGVMMDHAAHRSAHSRT